MNGNGFDEIWRIWYQVADRRPVTRWRKHRRIVPYVRLTFSERAQCLHALPSTVLRLRVIAAHFAVRCRGLQLAAAMFSDNWRLRTDWASTSAMAHNFPLPASWITGDAAAAHSHLYNYYHEVRMSPSFLRPLLKLISGTKIDYWPLDDGVVLCWYRCEAKDRC